MIAQTLTTSLKQNLFNAAQNFATDTFKIALYTASADLGAATTVYTSVGETSGAGYVAGGITLTGTTVATSGTTVYVNFNSATFSAAVTARGALIYNVSKGNKSVAVLDFGADKTSSTTFIVTMPANTATSALIRLP